MKRPIIAFALATLFVLVLGAACSSDDMSDGATDASPDSSGQPAAGVPAGEPDDGTFSDAEEPLEGDALGGGQTEDSGSPNPAGLQTSLDRKIVQNSSIDIGVEDVGRQFQELVGIATSSGGFVLSSAFSNADDEQTADITIRVPNDRYTEVLADIRAMGTVQTEESNASDVTEEYTDLQSRMRQLRAEEQQYLALLEEAQNIEQILLVQDRLNSVIAQIEQVQGRINLLDNLSELATITVHLRPLSAGAGGAGLGPVEAAENAWEASLETLRALAVVAVAVIAYSWWLIPVAVIGYLGVRWYTSKRTQPPTSASA
jgi:hypothetical protein